MDVQSRSASKINHHLSDLKIEVFKTNVEKKKEASTLLKGIETSFVNTKANFDLEDCDKILRVQSDKISVSQIKNYLKLKGYECELLPD